MPDRTALPGRGDEPTTRKKVVVVGHGAFFHALCQNCGWEVEKANREIPTGRAAARRHVARTGHLVDADRHDFTTLGPEDADAS